MFEIICLQLNIDLKYILYCKKYKSNVDIIVRVNQMIFVVKFLTKRA